MRIMNPVKERDESIKGIAFGLKVLGTAPLIIDEVFKPAYGLIKPEQFIPGHLFWCYHLDIHPFFFLNIP